MSSIRFATVLVAILMALAISLAYPVSALSLQEIKSIASSPQPGDVMLIWIPGDVWNEPQWTNGVLYHTCTWPGLTLVRRDGTTVFVQPNFWNIVSAEGENYFRVTDGNSTAIFYANLRNVALRWGGVTWISPAVDIAGRAPPQFNPNARSVGGYAWFSLPMSAYEIDLLSNVYVKADYSLARSAGSLVRFGISMWFENLQGGAIAEAYIAFHDDYGGHPGTRTVVKTIQVPAIVNGNPVVINYELQRAVSGGGWAVIVFYPTNFDLVEGSIIIDILPLVREIVSQLVDYFRVPREGIVWSSLSIGALAGSSTSSIELGYVLRDARVLNPSEVPTITATVTTTTTPATTPTTTVTRTTTPMTTTLVETTTTVVVTTTITSTATNTITSVVTETKTETVAIIGTTTVQQFSTDIVTIIIVLLIIGLVVGLLIGGRK